MAQSLAAIVTGLPRSGTTVIGRTLMSHPEIWGGFEGGVLLDDFSQRVHARWLGEGRWHWGLSKADHKRVLAAVEPADQYAIMLAGAGHVQRDSDFHFMFENFRRARFVVDKTPQYCLALSAIMRKTSAPVFLVFKPFPVYLQSLLSRGHEWHEAWSFWLRFLQQLEQALANQRLRERLYLFSFVDYLSMPEAYNRYFLEVMTAAEPQLEANQPLSLERYLLKLTGPAAKQKVGTYSFSSLKPVTAAPAAEHPELRAHAGAIAGHHEMLAAHCIRPRS